MSVYPPQAVIYDLFLILWPNSFFFACAGKFFGSFYFPFVVEICKKKLAKDLDESTNSIDVSSNEENGTVHDENTQVPAILVTSVLQTMATLDDVDDDEAFINELMAMHPNDEDIVVEDLENNVEDLRVLQEGLRTTEDVAEVLTTPEPPEQLTTPEPPPDDNHDDGDDDGDGVRMQKTGVFPLYRSLVRSRSFALLPVHKYFHFRLVKRE